MHPATLLAQSDPPAKKDPSLLDPQLLWATGALVVTLLLGALVMSLFDRWRKRPDASLLTPGAQLAAFRSSYERGELSQEEFERIRARLAPRLRQELDLPPKRTPAKPDPPPGAATPGTPETPPPPGP